MKTLIYLLNIYALEKFDCEYVFVEYRPKEHSFDTFADGAIDYMTDLYVVSKRFGFVNWLVKNDKIDRQNNHALQYAREDLSEFFTEWESVDGESNEVACLIMLLSIQKEPINLLCELLNQCE